MRQLSLGLAGICAISAVLGLAVWVAQSRAQQETSVLVQKPVEKPSPGPALQSPANEPTLPPPVKPELKPTIKPAATPPQVAPVAKQPFMRPAQPLRRVPVSTALAVTEEPMPVPDAPPEMPEIEVRPAPPIEYDTDGDARRMYRRSGEIQLVMLTEDPTDHCVYEIPLCVPGCCIDEPVVSSGQGIFGRGVVEYCWPSCGFRAIVKFRHVLGDVRVDYEGD